MPRASTKKKPQNYRASWKGELRLGLVRFSVEAINVHSTSGSDVHFHQLHAKCHRRIEYKKSCPEHGDVTQNEIVLGYETSPGRYVEIDPDELESMRTDADRALSLEEFITADEVDDIYLDGRIYYLQPQEKNDEEPYRLLCEAMESESLVGVGHVVFSGKEQLVIVRPRDVYLVMYMLNYGPEIREFKPAFQTTAKRLSAANMRLAKDLIRSLTAKHFSFADFRDRYRERVLELLEAKRRGQEVVQPPEEEEEPVINLMEALKRSLPQSTKASTKRGSKSDAKSSAKKQTKKTKRAHSVA